RIEAQRRGGVLDDCAVDSGVEAEAGRAACGREPAARVAEVEGQEGGGGVEAGQGAVGSPATVGDADQRPVDRAGLAGDAGDVILAQLQPLHGDRGAGGRDVGDAAVRGDQTPAGVEDYAPRQLEIE